MFDWEKKPLLSKEIQEHMGEWMSKKEKLLNESLDEVELYILKCHIFLEHELNGYLDNRMISSTPIGKAGLSFSAKIKLARLLDCFEFDSGDGLEDFLVNINILRNQIAHSFQYDLNIIEKLLAIQSHLITRDKQALEPPSQKGTRMFDYAVTYFGTQLGIKWKIDLTKHFPKLIELGVEVFSKQMELIKTDPKYADVREVLKEKFKDPSNENRQA